LLKGCDHETAYEAIGYEIETDTLLRKIRVDLGGTHSEDFERIALMLENPSLHIPRVRPRLYSRPVNTVPPVTEAYERPSPPSTFPSSPPLVTEGDPALSGYELTGEGVPSETTQVP